jgi:UDP-glucose 4-epimerase
VILVFGGAGFVGLNVVAALLAAGRRVTVFDRTPLPAAAASALSTGVVEIVGDVTDRQAVERAITPEIDAIVLAAAITPDAARESAAASDILRVNLLSHVAILERARAVGVRRIVNLSSTAAYGDAAEKATRLDEALPAEPSTLYAITKFAAERVGNRLASLWGLDYLSVRLSAVFGPWERATGVRDTLSAPSQILEAAALGTPALLARPGVRDWIYAPDVATAIIALLDAPKPQHRLYNIGPGVAWSALAWGQLLASRRPGLVCRLVEAGETPTIDLHSATDRPPLDPGRIAAELGWRPNFDCAASVDHLDAWSRRIGGIG